MILFRLFMKPPPPSLHPSPNDPLKHTPTTTKVRQVAHGYTETRSACHVHCEHHHCDQVEEEVHQLHNQPRFLCKLQLFL
jgi:hypothetical protein